MKNKEYYLDIDAILEKCISNPSLKDDTNSDKSELEINVFKYEIYKMMTERVLNEIDMMDEEEDDVYLPKTNSISFNLAFNTLRYSGIIFEYDQDDE